jgi:hypothetical protein
MMTNPDRLQPDEIEYEDERDEFQIMLGRMRRHHSADVCEDGKWRFTYNLYFKGQLIFSGHEFLAPPGIAENRNVALSEILGFLSLKPGDTDEDYFDNYTPEQLAFAEEYGDELFIWSEELVGREEE